VDALEPRAVDPDLAPGHRRRQARDERRFELEGERLLARRREGVGPHDRDDDAADQPHDAVVVDPRDIGEALGDALLGAADRLVARLLGGRIVGGVEQGDQAAGDVRRPAERLDHGGEAVGQAGLAQIAEPGAEQDDALRLQPHRDQQLVERVILRAALEHCGDDGFDHLGPRHDRRAGALIRGDDEEFVDMALARPLEPGRRLLEHAEAEILEHRYRVGQGHERALAIDFEAEVIFGIALELIKPDRTAAIVGEPVQPQDVLGRVGGRIAGAERRREGRSVAHRQPRRPRRPDQRAERLLDRRLPAADHQVELAVERFGIGRRRLRIDVQRVADEGEIAVAEIDRPVRDPSLRRLLDHLADRDAAARGELVARQPDEREHVALEDRADQDQGGARPIGEGDRGGGEMLHLLRAEIDEQVARQGRQSVAQRLAAMAAGIEAEFLLQLRELAAQQRHLLDRRGQRLARPEPGMDADPLDLLALAQRHDDEVERDAAVDRRAQVRLGEQRLLAALLEIADRALAAAFVGRIVGEAHDAEPFGRLLPRPLDLVAQEGHRAVGEPVEQGAALLVGDRIRLGVHLLLHGPPVGDGGADVGEDAAQLGSQLAAALRVRAVDLEIHDRLAALPVLAERLDRGQAAVLVAVRADDRMEQPMDDQAAGGDRLGDGIDQEGHVVVDDADPHPPLAEPRAGGFDPHEGAAGLAAVGAAGDEGGGGAAILGPELLELPWQGAGAERAGKAVDQAGVGGVIRGRAAGAAPLRRGFGSRTIFGFHQIRSRKLGPRHPLLGGPIDPPSPRRQGWPRAAAPQILPSPCKGRGEL
jgi:hypothetical protein